MSHFCCENCKCLCNWKLLYSRTFFPIIAEDPNGLNWGDCPVSSIVLAGYERCRGNKWEAVYVGRALISKKILKPGKYVPGEGVLVVHTGKEGVSDYWQELCNPLKVTLKWIHFDGGDIPVGAVLGGYQDGFWLYIGRTKLRSGDTVVGHVSSSKNLWYGWKGEEYHTNDFEILVQKKSWWG